MKEQLLAGLLPKSTFVIALSLFEFLSVVSAEEKHADGHYRKKNEQIGTLSVKIPISVDSVQGKNEHPQVQILRIP
ncbi:hypothetical protein [Pricia antarctica]|uniref:hypothetical protein n=1 Tax=Pricia antarctica TaxID=641691 RepID=UPI00158723CC|nr:hypothetical protein [Pricia antarctica]